MRKTQFNQGVESGSQEHIKAAHQAACEWAGTILSSPFVILDYETNGLPGEPVQIAIIDHEGHPLINTLIKPEDAPALLARNLKSGSDFQSAADIHGITPEMVKDAPSFADVYPRFMDAVQGKIILAYNTAFEQKVTLAACDRYGLAWPESRYECAMLAYARFHGDWSVHPKYGGSFKWQKLEDACKAHGLEIPGSAHDALTDVRMTLNLIRRMAGVQNTLTIHTGQISRVKNDPDFLDITIKSASTESGQALAPTWEMVNRLKEGKWLWERYEIAYYDLIRQRFAKSPAPIRELLRKDRIVLACYCDTPEQCHRRLAADILTKLARQTGIPLNLYGEILPAPAPEQASMFTSEPKRQPANPYTR